MRLVMTAAVTVCVNTVKRFRRRRRVLDSDVRERAACLVRLSPAPFPLLRRVRERRASPQTPGVPAANGLSARRSGRSRRRRIVLGTGRPADGAISYPALSRLPLPRPVKRRAGGPGHCQRLPVSYCDLAGQSRLLAGTPAALAAAGSPAPGPVLDQAVPDYERTLKWCRQHESRQLLASGAAQARPVSGADRGADAAAWCGNGNQIGRSGRPSSQVRQQARNMNRSLAQPGSGRRALPARDPQEVVAMTGRAQDARRPRHGRRAAVIGAAAAATAAAVLGPVSGALAAPRVVPAPSPAAAGISRTGEPAGPVSGGFGTPAGWAPVPYRRAQLSVPGLWLVETPQQFLCAPQSGGMIFAGSKPAIPKAASCGPTASRAWIRPAGHIPPGIRHRKPTAVIHGIPVYRLPSGPKSVLYLVPELGVRVGARGPLARRVLATLTRSPLSVVLRRGPAGTVPAHWIRHRFGGVEFPTPRSWSLQRENQWATCGTGLVPRALLLIDATRPRAPLPCPYPYPTAAAERAQPGLTVVTGKYAAKSVGEDFARCRVRRDVRICLSSVTGQGGLYGGVLIFSVSRPHRHRTTFFLLGLPGSGARARAILGSIRAARH